MFPEEAARFSSSLERTVKCAWDDVGAVPLEGDRYVLRVAISDEFTSGRAIANITLPSITGGDDGEMRLRRPRPAQSGKDSSSTYQVLNGGPQRTVSPPLASRHDSDRWPTFRGVGRNGRCITKATREQWEAPGR